MMLTISNESAADMRERIQHLKAIERTRYQLPHYVSELTTYAHDDGAVDCRLQYVLDCREETLHRLYNYRWVGAAVMGTASFIFDRYLSQVVPKYVLVGQAEMPFRVNVIGAACLFIASKSLLSASECYTMERSLHRNECSSDIIRAERDILTKLDWDIIYPSPISIVEDLLTLLPGKCGYEKSDASIQAFERSVLSGASYVTRLAAIHFGFISTFPPSTIALASLKLVLEDPSVQDRGIAAFKLVSPTSYFTLVFDQLHLGLSFEDQDVKYCYEWLINVLENSSSQDVYGKRSPSPTKVEDIHNKKVL